MFSLDVTEIKELNDIQNTYEDIQSKLCKYGGPKGLVSKLKVDPLRGLSNEDKQDLASRQEEYGRNEVLEKSPKRFIDFILDHVQDKRILILLMCAIICLSLSFMHSKDLLKTG